MRFVILLCLLPVTLLHLSGCDIYKSGDRKQFEEDHLSTAAAHFNTLQFTHCSDASLRTESQPGPVLFSNTDAENRVWIFRRYDINNQSIYEADNMNGEYCFYENTDSE